MGLSSYAEKVDVDPARLEQLEERLDLIHGLKRKYGASIADILAFGTKAQTQLAQLEQREGEIARIDAQMKKVKKQLEDQGAELSARRRKLIPQLSKAVTRQLADLGFKQSLFEISLTPRNPVENEAGGVHANLYGFDQVEFRFAPNPGELTQPLRAIASSGELARVMLALKTVLAAEDRIPVLIFDEVDANVGGETARAVGEKMQQIARQRQVLCITHLPQVAAPATAHYVVIKEVEGGRTFTEVSLLNAQERVTELARMLGGQTEAARKHAKEMLSAS